MVPPLRRYGIFLFAVRAEGERIHGSHTAVVRKVGDEGESRAAIRATREWVPISPFCGIVHLLKASWADGSVCGNPDTLGTGAGGNDVKSFGAFVGYVQDFLGFYVGQRR
jgi:hypothetical protein